MAWRCFMVDDYEASEGRPGAVWFEEYKGERKWVLMLPDGCLFYQDQQSTDGSFPWTSEGEPPNITVSPSIHDVGLYHGFVTGGVISDDVNGRKFPQHPNTA